MKIVVAPEVAVVFDGIQCGILDAAVIDPGFDDLFEAVGLAADVEVEGCCAIVVPE